MRAIVLGVGLVVLVALIRPLSPHAAPHPPMAAQPTGMRWIDIDEGRGVYLRAAVAWPEGRDRSRS